MTALNSLRHAVLNASEMGPRAQMRAALPHLDDLVRRGATYEILISALAELGMPVQLTSLRMAVYRWRKAQGAPGASDAEIPQAQAISGKFLPQLTSATGVLPAGSSRPGAAGIPKGMPVREFLRRLRDTPVDPAEEARREREWNRARATQKAAEEQGKKNVA